MPAGGTDRLAGLVSEPLLPGSDDGNGMKIATVAERPELLEPAWDRTRDTLPEYNNHGDVLNELGTSDRGAA